MRGEISIFRPVEAYAEAGSSRTHGVVAIISFCVFVGTIVFGFVPVTREIETSGYSTADLQEATTRTDVDAILQAFEPVMDSSFFSLCSITSLSSLGSFSFSRSLSRDEATVVRRPSSAGSEARDGADRLFTAPRLTGESMGYPDLPNPDSYPTALISLMNTTQSAKWLVVTIEYPTLGLAIVLVLLVRFTSLFDGKTPRI